jgi:hypothetical protein
VNSYSGGTTLLAGTLGINADAAPGQQQLRRPERLHSAPARPSAPTSSFAIARPINVASGVNATMQIAGITTGLTGPISGSGTILAGISGSGGTLTLSNTTSTFTGTLTIGSASLVKLNSSGALTSGTINLAPGGTLDLNGKTFSGVLSAQSGTFGNAFNGAGSIANSMPVITNSDTANTAVINTNQIAGGILGNLNGFWQMRGTGNITFSTFWTQIGNSNTGHRRADQVRQQHPDDHRRP